MPVGERVEIHDGIAKVTGKAVFTGDIKLPGMLYAKVLRSPHAHALIKNVDLSIARQLPGVKAAISFADIPQVPYNGCGAPDKELIHDQYILNDKVRFVGDGVAAVAAVDEETAAEALKQIKVEYEILPSVLTAEEALAEGAPCIHGGENNILTRIAFEDGNVEKGLAEADYVFEDRFITSKVTPASLEPCGVSVASFDSQGRLTVWTSTQMPFVVRGILARALNLPYGKIRVIKPFVGGGFGSRLGAISEPLCSLLSMITGKPVKLQFTREEAFIATETRHPVIFKLRTGMTKDGIFTAREMKAVVDTGAYATHGPFIAGIIGSWFSGTYRCSNVKYEGLAVYTNTVSAGAFRGYANPQVAFAVESQLDIIARKIGYDPVELRRKNYLKEGETWRFTGWPLECSVGLPSCLEEGMKRIRWGERSAPSSPSKKRGKGMAISMHCSGGRPRLNEVSSATIKLNEDGSANVYTGSTDMGQGSDTTLAQIAAEAMGIKYTDVIFSGGEDTDVNPFDIGTRASRQAYSGGHVVKKSGEIIRGRLLEHASRMLEAPANSLEIGSGEIWLKDNPAVRISVGDVSRYAQIRGGGQIVAAVSEEPPGNPPAYGAQFAEVEVDTKTGEVAVLQVVACHDVGRAINPTVVEGQIEGAIQQGVGYALLENLVIDKKTGRILNDNLLDYKMLTFPDMPQTDVCIIEAPSRTGPYGVKSVGESGLVPTAAAIANAIFDATGIRICELPITPEKILDALNLKE